jgi:hypothetical protein
MSRAAWASASWPAHAEATREAAASPRLTLARTTTREMEGIALEARERESGGRNTRERRAVASGGARNYR